MVCLGGGGIGVALLAPIGALFWLAANPQDNIWPHLWRTVLPGQINTTLYLMGAVAFVTATLGTGTAWLVTFCRFPGRDMLAVALLFPLAMPTYLLAYAYSDFFDDAGPVFSLWQAFLPGLAYPSLHSLGGAVFVMSLVLYPYVFLSTRAAFIQQARGPVEAARSLGHGPASCFWRISLPLARPALIVGVSLALMECLNDIGAVEHLGVRTLTIGVYDTWLVRGNLAGAAQMALVLLGFIALLLALERSHRGAQAYAARAGQPAINAPAAVIALGRLGGMAALLACLLPVLLGFILPVMLFFDHAARAEIHYGLAAATRNSVFLAMLAALLTCLIGMVMAYAARLQAGRAMTLLTNAASLGYAVPGAVLAIGVMVVLAQAEAIKRRRAGFWRHADRLAVCLFDAVYAAGFRHDRGRFRAYPRRYGYGGAQPWSCALIGFTPCAYPAFAPRRDCRRPHGVCRCDEGITGHADFAPI